MKPRSWRRFFADLGRRRVWRAAGFYVLTGVAVVEAADLFLPRLGLPDWTVTLVVALVVLGFPLAMALAWVFDISPEGVRRTTRMPWEEEASPVGLRSLVVPLAVVLPLAVGGWWAFSAVGGSESEIERIAVLPLADLMREAGQEYFVQGMHDGLITELQEAGVPVIARTSVMRYGDGETSIREIARQLDVDAVVEGAVYRAGDSVRVDARIVDPATEEYVWRRSFGGSLRDVVALHRRLTRAIADEIEAAIAPEDAARLARSSPVDPRAYDAYLRGVFHSQRFTPEDLDRALEYFRSALAIDSTYAPAHVGIARVWMFRAQLGVRTGVTALQARRQAQPALERALELAGTLVEARAAEAAMMTWNGWRFEEGAAAYQRVIQANPGHAEARMFYAHVLTILGRWDEALEQARLAVELDPLNPFVQGLHGVVLNLTRRHEEAVEVFEAMFRDHPDAGFGRRPLAVSYEAVGRYEDALRIEKEMATMQGAADVVAALDRGWAEGGYRTALRTAAESLAARAESGRTPAMHVANFYARTGEADEAVEWLERALEVRNQNLPYIGVAPHAERLHDHPGFQEVARRVGVPVITEAGGT